MKKYLSLLMLAIVMMCSSCTKQEVYVYEVETLKTITIYINSQTLDTVVHSAKTRSALITDPKSVENTVNSLTIAIFKSDGTIKTIKEFSAPGNSVTMRVANLTTTDKVICVANAKPNTFTSVKTLDEFNNKEVSLDDALTINTVDIVANNLIMYGTGPITGPTTGSVDAYTANVDMYHLNSKVSINALTLSIPSNATFTLKEVYMINVPASFKFSYDNPFVAKSYEHGSLYYSIPNQTQRLYLGYSNNTVNKLFFYCSPNNSVKYTRIVICGSYDIDGYGPIQPKDTYYPIIVDKNMLSNKNYGMNITIKGIGVDSPTDELNYSNLTVTMNINSFDTISKDVVFD